MKHSFVPYYMFYALQTEKHHKPQRIGSYRVSLKKKGDPCLMGLLGYQKPTQGKSMVSFGNFRKFSLQ